MVVTGIAKRCLRGVLPRWAITAAKTTFTWLVRHPERWLTRRVLARAVAEPEILAASDLEMLQGAYPLRTGYGYDPGALERRGQERARQILRLPGMHNARHFLEIGCLDGMVAGALARRGLVGTAIDIHTDRLDRRAVDAGAHIARMDAANIGFRDASFDVVYSFDVLEHVASPLDVLRESVRVLKPGGTLFLEFGPLYRSAFGEHAYRSITVPYCQFLFEKATLNDFALRHGLTPIDFDHVNGWSLNEYRDLWEILSTELDTVRYEEIQNLSHLNLIRAHPRCFRHVSDDIEEFLVAVIRVHFRKRATQTGQ